MIKATRGAKQSLRDASKPLRLDNVLLFGNYLAINGVLFALDFETSCGIDCDRCWPIKYLKCRPRVCEIESWARWRCVERAGEFFLAQRLSNLFGVLNIAGAAVSPSLLTELKRY